MVNDHYQLPSVNIYEYRVTSSFLQSQGSNASLNAYGFSTGQGKKMPGWNRAWWESMENVGKITKNHGKPMENPWKSHGKAMAK